MEMGATRCDNMDAHRNSVEAISLRKYLTNFNVLFLSTETGKLQIHILNNYRIFVTRLILDQISHTLIFL